MGPPNAPRRARALAGRRTLWRRAFALCWGLIAACRAQPSPSLAVCPTLPCQTASGRQADGACAYTPLPNGTSCNDANPCSAYDTCQNGQCQAGALLPDGTACDDKNACTQNDRCQSGVCRGGPLVVCGTPGTCQGAKACDPVLGCIGQSSGPCVEHLTALPLSGCTFSGYTAPVLVGGQAMQLLVDSGSSSTAVASVACSNCNDLSPLYDDGGGQGVSHVTASYTDGSGFVGTAYTDSVEPGAAATGDYGPAVSMRVVGITQQSNFFTGSVCQGTRELNAYQGIWGLGPTQGALGGTDGFAQALYATGALSYDAFAVQLCEVGGRLWLGGYDPSAGGNSGLLQTPMMTAAQGDASHYTVSLADVQLGGVSLGLTSFAYGSVIVDSGSGALYLPSAALVALRQMLSADANVTAHLDARCLSGDDPDSRVAYAGLNNESVEQMDAALPWLTLSFPQGGARPNVALLLRPTKSYLTAFSEGPSGTTLYAFTAFASGTTILGASVLKEHVVVFDRGQGLVGFYPQTNGCSASLASLP